jgi:hypothetical protein
MSNPIERDIFQPKYQFDIQIKIYNKIIKYFPDLSPPISQLLSRAIVNKLCEGVEYPNEIEHKINEIYSVIMTEY